MSESCNVSGILVKDVMSQNVITVTPQDSVVEVGNLLAERSISAAVVLKNAEILGVISKEDFVLGVKYMGVNPLDSFKVKDFMKEYYEKVDVNDQLNVAVDKILSAPHRVDRVLVLDDGKLAGVVTLSDISKVYAQKAKGCLKVRDVMEVNPSVVYDYTPMSKIIDEITIAKGKRVIVMAGNQVLGVITILDLSLALFEKLKAHPGKDVIDLLSLDDLVTLNPLLSSEEDDSAVAAKLMVDKKVGGLPVFDEELKGVVTKMDMVKAYKILLDNKKFN